MPFTPSIAEECRKTDRKQTIDGWCSTFHNTTRWPFKVFHCVRMKLATVKRWASKTIWWSFSSPLPPTVRFNKCVACGFDFYAFFASRLPTVGQIMELFCYGIKGDIMWKELISMQPDPASLFPGSNELIWIELSRLRSRFSQSSLIDSRYFGWRMLTVTLCNHEIMFPSPSLALLSDSLLQLWRNTLPTDNRNILTYGELKLLTAKHKTRTVIVMH